MMDVKEYCEEMDATLNDWKGELCEMRSVINALPEKDQSLTLPEIGTLHDLVEDLNDKIDRAKASCPLDWSKAVDELQREAEELKQKTDSMWDGDHIAGGYVGG